MNNETGVEKVIHRLINLGIFAVSFAAVYFAIEAISRHSKADWTLPELSNHDFEWSIIILLIFILFECGCKCKCK